MKKNKNKMYIWLIAMSLSFAIIGCSAAKTASITTENTIKSGVSATDTDNENYLSEDLDTSYSDTDTKIELKSGSADITGEGAEFEYGNIKITQAGTYVFSGEFDGQIITDVGDEDLVHIVLDGVNITNTKSAAINGATGKKIVVTLVEGTTNILTDSSEYDFAEGEDEPDSALFVKNDLTVNGSGTLKVNANYKSGIKAKDNLKVISGNIDINSVNKAIKGNNSITVENADITINAEDDGITSDGSMVINGGNIKIEKSGEGLEAVTIDINVGNIDIVSSDDGINARGVLDDGASDEEKEAYGMEDQADTYLRVAGGVININSQADGIDSNGQVYIDGGEVYISGSTSGGDGALDYNGKAVITGGTFISAGTQEMFQSFDSSSTQNYINVFYSSAVSAGTEIKVTDKSGNVLLSYVPDKEYSSILISSDKLSTGEIVTVISGDNSNEITVSTGENTIGERTFGDGEGFPGNDRLPINGEKPTDANGNELQRPENFDQPPQKPTDENGNETERPQPPERKNMDSKTNEN